MKAEINRISLAYDIHGKTGHPVVLIHGLGLDRRIWTGMVSKYLRNYQVIMPDLRGHGESDSPQGVYEMALLAEDIVKLLEFLGISKATVCGHSLGGYVTLAIAEYFPEKLAGLGLITSRAIADDEDKRKLRYQLAKAVQKRGSVALAELLAPKLSLDRTVIRKAYNMIVNTPVNGIIGTLIGMAERPDQTALLAKITVPALVVAGGADQIIPLDESRALADKPPLGEYLEIPGAGHMAMMEAKAALAKGISDLIQRK